jgi:hypothetical protein
MLVSIRRSQDEGWFSTSYCLDAQIELTPEEAELVQRHDLSSLIVLDSEQRQEHYETAQEHLDSAGTGRLLPKGKKDKPPDTEAIFLYAVTGVASTVWNIGAGAYNLIAGSLDTSITVQSLIDGAHIEAETAEEILIAEKHIADALGHLKNYLIELSSFDGRETHHEL